MSGPRLVVGNWKMNVSRRAAVQMLDPFLAGVRELLAGSDAVEVVICPPFPYLAAVAERLGQQHVPVTRLPVTHLPVTLGAQDLSQHESGAHTGEVSGAMLLEFACKWVLAGHSERRQAHAESDQCVAEKCARARQTGLIPIVCVGETLRERQAGQVQEVLARQLDAVLAVGALTQPGNLVVAYEPVWAIGSGQTATGGQIEQTHAFIRDRLARAAGSSPRPSPAPGAHAAVATASKAGGTGGAISPPGAHAAAAAEIPAAEIPILYGGSVSPDNAPELFALRHVDGVLVGGASLRAESFLPIVRAALEAE